LPRLGLVVRFPTTAKGNGVKQLASQGFKVATSSDFKSATAVPNDLDGADVQYFERLGIAVVRAPAARMAPLLARADRHGAIVGARPEVRYRTLDRLTATEDEREIAIRADYLRGYRDGVEDMVERLLDGSRRHGQPLSPNAAERTTTWGIRAVGAAGSSLSGQGVRVAVLDTGFDDRHPDFRDRLVVKKRFASHSTDDDLDGHGTHCVGTACGPRDPASQPRYGVAHAAEIYAGKVIGDDGFATDRSILAGIEWALEQGCAVISMSLGSDVGLGEPPNDDYEHIGRVCLQAGTLVIAAAGNASARPNRIAPVSAPANASSIMAVGAIDRRIGVAAFSCGGRNPGQDVDVVAPGVDVLSCVPGGRYKSLDGTSMATPHVAGIAALLAQSDATLRGQALWTRLLQSCKSLPQSPRDVGRGLIHI
jgi:subtilisin family serine protease